MSVLGDGPALLVAALVGALVLSNSQTIDLNQFAFFRDLGGLFSDVAETIGATDLMHGVQLRLWPNFEPPQLPIRNTTHEFMQSDFSKAMDDAKLIEALETLTFSIFDPFDDIELLDFGEAFDVEKGAGCPCGWVNNGTHCRFSKNFMTLVQFWQHGSSGKRLQWSCDEARAAASRFRTVVDTEHPLAKRVSNILGRPVVGPVEVEAFLPGNEVPVATADPAFENVQVQKWLAMIMRHSQLFPKHNLETKGVSLFVGGGRHNFTAWPQGPYDKRNSTVIKHGSGYLFSHDTVMHGLEPSATTPVPSIFINPHSDTKLVRGSTGSEWIVQGGGSSVILRSTDLLFRIYAPLHKGSTEQQELLSSDEVVRLMIKDLRYRRRFHYREYLILSNEPEVRSKLAQFLSSEYVFSPFQDSYWNACAWNLPDFVLNLIPGCALVSNSGKDEL